MSFDKDKNKGLSKETAEASDVHNDAISDLNALKKSRGAVGDTL